jgi:hypothetical protein
MKGREQIMAMLDLSNKEIAELLTILHNSLRDINEQIRQAPDDETLTTLDARRELIDKWIHRLSQIGHESLAQPKNTSTEDERMRERGLEATGIPEITGLVARLLEDESSNRE